MILFYSDICFILSPYLWEMQPRYLALQLQGHENSEILKIFGATQRSSFEWVAECSECTILTGLTALNRTYSTVAHRNHLFSLMFVIMREDITETRL